MAGHVGIQERYIMARRNSEKLRLEYNEAVKEINKQLKALAKVDPSSVTLERYRGYFKPVTNKNPHYETMRQMKKQATDLLKSGQLSIEGHKRSVANAIETLHREGYGFINKRNFNSFMRFLDDARARGLGSLYSSEQLLDAINTAREKGLSEEEIKKNIARWSRQLATDKNGRTIEVENPAPLKVRRYAGRRK